MASINETRSKARTTRPGYDSLPRGHVTEIQRARMLSAAVETIEKNGYARLTVAQVIGRAKVSRKTFYDLFTDREDCFLAVFESALGQVSSRVVEAYEQESSWRESVRAGLAALLTFVDEEPGLARLCVVDALGGGPRVLEERARVLAQLRKVIDRGRNAAAGGREPAGVTAEGVIGAVFAVIHTRLLERSAKPYIGLHGPLMSMIVLPYLGSDAAKRELAQPTPKTPPTSGGAPTAVAPLTDLGVRVTYRTLRVLSAIAALPGASNRQIGKAAGIEDQGQISKLLHRLQKVGLIDNGNGDVPFRGASNAWTLTERGERITRSLGVQKELEPS